MLSSWIMDCLSTSFLSSWSNRWIWKKISSLCFKCLHLWFQIRWTHLKASLLNGWMMEEFILLNTRSFSKPIIENINCLVQKIPWPYTKVSLKKQIRHWSSRMVARNLDYEIYSSSNYNLIVEDNIQKIISANIFPDVPLLF